MAFRVGCDIRAVFVVFCQDALRHLVHIAWDVAVRRTVVAQLNISLAGFDRLFSNFKGVVVNVTTPSNTSQQRRVVELLVPVNSAGVGEAIFKTAFNAVVKFRISIQTRHRAIFATFTRLAAKISVNS